MKQLLNDSRELRQCLKETYAGDISAFREHILAETPDIDEDGIVDFIVDVGTRCSGHNSPYFIYQSVGKGYKLLLNITSIGIKLKKSKTNGFYDLLATSYGGMDLGGADIYKFNKGRYRATECYEWRPYAFTAKPIKIHLKLQKCGDPT